MVANFFCRCEQRSIEKRRSFQHAICRGVRIWTSSLDKSYSPLKIAPPPSYSWTSIASRFRSCPSCLWPLSLSVHFQTLTSFSGDTPTVGFARFRMRWPSGSIACGCLFGVWMRNVVAAECSGTDAPARPEFYEFEVQLEPILNTLDCDAAVVAAIKQGNGLWPAKRRVHFIAQIDQSLSVDRNTGHAFRLRHRRPARKLFPFCIQCHDFSPLCR